MRQPTLFDEEPKAAAPIARASDPVTSHKAAAETSKKLTRLHTAFFEMLKFQCDARKKSVTAIEVAAACVLAFPGVANQETWRKRAGELLSEEYGQLIEVDGTRLCEMTGRSARTFKVRKGIQ
jgi:hypothetical protein